MPSIHREERVALVVALSLAGALAPGCNQVFGLEETVPARDHPNVYSCACTCFAGDRDELMRAFDVCVPPALNANLDGGVLPTPADLASDCDTRVKNTLVGILQQCGSNSMKNRLESDPSACSCAPVFFPTRVNACNGDCQSVPLAADCSNQATATSVGNLPPVCIAEPSTSGQQAVGRVLFGDRSICEVSGTLAVVRGDDDPVSTDTSGIVEIAGQPCPGASCAVDMVYRLAQGGSLDFDSYAGFASVEFRDIHVSGATLSPAMLDGAGNGEFAASALSSSARGTREEEVVFGTISDTITRSYTAINVDPIDVGVDWAGRQCALVGALLAAEIEGAETDIALDVTGTIVSQPPRADAGGPTREIECESAAGATVALSPDASTDPDGDIRFRDWWIGHPGGAPVAPDADGEVSRVQALGATTYVLSVTDSRMAVSQDSVVVSVVDTTAPEITSLSGSPTLLFPLDHRMVPVTVSIAATDLCGGATSCEITSVTMNQPIDALGDGNTEPDWVITGPLTVDLRAESSAVRKSRVYTIHVTCSDPSGNGAGGTVAVRVPVNR